MLDLDIFKNLLIVLVSPSHHFITEVVVQRCSVKKVFLEISQNSQENTCARASFLIELQASVLKLYWKETLPQSCNFIKKETLAQVFSCKFCENFKNTFS